MHTRVSRVCVTRRRANTILIQRIRPSISEIITSHPFPRSPPTPDRRHLSTCQHPSPHRQATACSFPLSAPTILLRSYRQSPCGLSENQRPHHALVDAQFKEAVYLAELLEPHRIENTCRPTADASLRAGNVCQANLSPASYFRCPNRAPAADGHAPIGPGARAAAR